MIYTTLAQDICRLEVKIAFEAEWAMSGAAEIAAFRRLRFIQGRAAYGSVEAVRASIAMRSIVRSAHIMERQLRELHDLRQVASLDTAPSI